MDAIPQFNHYPGKYTTIPPEKKEQIVNFPCKVAQEAGCPREEIRRRRINVRLRLTGRGPLCYNSETTE